MIRNALPLFKSFTTVSDRELITRYLADNNDTTFDELIRRYSRLVRSVAADLAPDFADDVAQATFVLFQKNVSKVAERESALGWLCETARRLSLKARTAAARRRKHELKVAKPIAVGDHVDEISLRQARAIVLEEVYALPEPQRIALLLIYWEGATQSDAAIRLNCSLSTLKRRLELGRERLVVRLARRGFGPATALTVLTATAVQSAATSPISLETLTPLAITLVKQSSWSALTGKIAATLILLVAGTGIGMQYISSPVVGNNPAEPPKPHENVLQTEKLVDVVGDPLPPGAEARLGSARLRGNHVVLLPDGKRVAQELGNGNLQISEIPSGKPLVVIHAKDVPERDNIIGSTIGFSSDGKRMAAVCWEGRCGIWDTDTGKLIRWVECSFYSVVTARFSPDGRYLAVGNIQKNLQKDQFEEFLYDLKTGEMVTKVIGSNGEFSKDGKTLLAWNDYGFCTQPPYRISIPDGKVLSQGVGFPVNRGGSHTVVGPDSDLYFNSIQNRVKPNEHRCIDLKTGEEKYSITLGIVSQQMESRILASDKHSTGVIYSHQGRVMAGFDLKTGKELWKQAYKDNFDYYALLSYNSREFITLNKDRTLTIWDMDTGKEIRTVTFLNNGQAMPRLFTDDGRYSITQSYSIFASVCVVWDMKTGKPFSQVPGHTATIQACSFSRDGRLALTASEDHTVRVWDAKNGQEQKAFRVEKPEFVTFSADGSTVYVGSKTGTVSVCDLARGEISKSEQVFAKTLAGMELIEDGKQLVMAGTDRDDDSGRLRIFDVDTFKESKSFALEGKPCEKMALQSNGATVAISHLNRTISIWNFQAGQKLSNWQGKGVRVSSWVRGKPTPYEVGSLSLSSNGRKLAYSDQELGIAFIDLHNHIDQGRAITGCYYQSPAARDELSDAVAWSPDGRTLAYSGSESSNKIILIDSRTRKVRRTFTAVNDQNRAVAWSPDGTKLMSAGADGTALIWNLQSTNIKPTPIDQWWHKLAHPSPTEVENLMSEMVSKPAEAVSLIQKQLKPVAVVSSETVGNQITDLIDKDKTVREKAKANLLAVADQARAQLSDMKRFTTNEEQANALKEILATVDGTQPMATDRLRASRAIEILERIASPDAKTLLKSLAQGAAGSDITTEADESLQRIQKRK